MRPHRVVVAPPLRNDDSRLFEGVEDLPVEQFIPEPCVETLAISVFPGGPRFDVCGLCPDSCYPVANDFSYKLWSIV